MTPRRWAKVLKMLRGSAPRPPNLGRRNTLLLIQAHPMNYSGCKIQSFCLTSRCRPHALPPSLSLKPAANGASLNAIGRGMFSIHTVTIVAFIFRDSDLVHNLLDIAPFADLGCTDTFTAKRFTLTHLSKNPILVGTRHTANLWRIPIPWHAPCPVPDFGANQFTLLH